MLRMQMRFVVLLGSLLCLTTWAVGQQKASKQVVFSTTASAATSGTFTYNSATVADNHFGFWVWCEGDSTNPYAGKCQGAMYFYGLGLTEAVSGIVTEPVADSYAMTVHSADNKVSCTLTNTPPIASGLKNLVSAACSAPSGTGTSPYTVVKVTGPAN